MIVEARGAVAGDDHQAGGAVHRLLGGGGIVGLGRGGLADEDFALARRESDGVDVALLVVDRPAALPGRGEHVHHAVLFVEHHNRPGVVVNPRAKGVARPAPRCAAHIEHDQRVVAGQAGLGRHEQAPLAVRSGVQVVVGLPAALDEHFLLPGGVRRAVVVDGRNHGVRDLVAPQHGDLVALEGDNRGDVVAGHVRRARRGQHEGRAPGGVVAQAAVDQHLAAFDISHPQRPGRVFGDGQRLALALCHRHREAGVEAVLPGGAVVAVAVEPPPTGLRGGCRIGREDIRHHIQLLRARVPQGICFGGFAVVGGCARVRPGLRRPVQPVDAVSAPRRAVQNAPPGAIMPPQLALGLFAGRHRGRRRAVAEVYIANVAFLSQRRSRRAKG